MNNTQLLAVCDKSYTLEVFYIIKICFLLICYLTPIIIIINTSIGLFKAVKTGKDEDIKASFKQSIRNIIAGFIVLIIPTLFSFIFTGLVDAEGDNILSCMNSATIEKVNALKEQEREERLAEKEAEDRKLKQETDKRTEEEKQRNDAIPDEKKKAPGSTSSGSNGGTSNSGSGSSDVTVNSNGISGTEFSNKLSSMQTPTMAQIESAASANGISKDYLKIVIGTTQREGYVNDPYLYYGWASAMLNNQVSLSQMQGWDPYHSGDANYYSEANITSGYNNATADVLKSVYIALTERNTKIVECNGMYSSTPSSYNLLYKSSVYNCAIYETK